MSRFNQKIEKTPEEKIEEKESLLREMIEERNKFYKENVHDFSVDYYSAEAAAARLKSMSTKISFQQTSIDKIKREELALSEDYISMTRIARKRR